MLVDEHADGDARHVEAVEEVLELRVEHGVQVAVRALLELEHALRTRHTQACIIHNACLTHSTRTHHITRRMTVLCTCTRTESRASLHSVPRTQRALLTCAGTSLEVKGSTNSSAGSPAALRQSCASARERRTRQLHIATFTDACLIGAAWEKDSN